MFKETKRITLTTAKLMGEKALEKCEELGLIAGNYVVKKLSQEKFGLLTHGFLIFVGLLCFK